MTAILVSVAELSNIFSVLAVLICFCGVFLFIMRHVYATRYRVSYSLYLSVYLPLRFVGFPFSARIRAIREQHVAGDNSDRPRRWCASSGRGRNSVSIYFSNDVTLQYLGDRSSEIHEVASIETSRHVSRASVSRDRDMMWEFEIGNVRRDDVPEVNARTFIFPGGIRGRDTIR